MDYGLIRMNSQEIKLEKNWKHFNEIHLREKSQNSDEDLTYLGRKFYDPNNPPFIATIVRVNATLWENIQKIQANMDKTDSRQTFFHPNYFHITLNEFGWADQLDITQVSNKLRKILEDIYQFDIKIRGINCFEKILFAQVFDEKQVLESIFNKTHEEFPFLERHFPDYIPHISLVRIETSEARDLIKLIYEKYRDIEIGTMKVEEIQLLAVRPYLTVGRIEIIEKIKLE